MSTTENQQVQPSSKVIEAFSYLVAVARYAEVHQSLFQDLWTYSE